MASLTVPHPHLIRHMLTSQCYTWSCLISLLLVKKWTCSRLWVHYLLWIHDALNSFKMLTWGYLSTWRGVEETCVNYQSHLFQMPGLSQTSKLTAFKSLTVWSSKSYLFHCQHVSRQKNLWAICLMVTKRHVPKTLLSRQLSQSSAKRSSFSSSMKKEDVALRNIVKSTEIQKKIFSHTCLKPKWFLLPPQVINPFVQLFLFSVSPLYQLTGLV